MMSIPAILLISFLQLLTSTPDDIELVFAGDAMQHGPQIKSALQSDGTYDYTPCFEFVKEDVANADFAALNLECPLGGKPYSGYPCFSAPDEYARELKEMGFDLFLTANNHTLDKRDRGALRTIQVLDSLEIDHVGTYRNEKERMQRSPLIKNIEGYEIAFLGYTYGTNGIPVQGEMVVNKIDKAKISDDISKARKAGADMVCVMIHWGVEYVMLPNKEQKDIAEFLINEGADIIIGGHSHVVQPFEMRFNPRTGKNVLLVYSLGNFISNQNDTNSRGGAMLRLRIGVRGMSVVIKDASYSLVFVQKPSAGNRNYQLIPVSRPELIKPHSRVQYDQFLKNARKILDKYNIGVSER